MRHSAFPIVCMFSFSPCSNTSPDAPFDCLGWGTANGVHTICAAVLLVVQKPSRVSQPSHLNRVVPQTLQEFGYTVHVQQNTCASSTDKTNPYIHTEGQSYIIFMGKKRLKWSVFRINVEKLLSYITLHVLVILV